MVPHMKSNNGPLINRAIYVRGVVPSSKLRQFCTRRAFIYFLEAWAQILVGIACHELLGPRYTSFCDNDAAKHALLKGYGRDTTINNMLGLFWTFMEDIGGDPWIERASSAANLSDEFSRA